MLHGGGDEHASALWWIVSFEGPFSFHRCHVPLLRIEPGPCFFHRGIAAYFLLAVDYSSGALARFLDDALIDCVTIPGPRAGVLQDIVLDK